MLNVISIMGRVVNELELKTTSNDGHFVVSFRIATQRNYKVNNSYPADFFNIVAWRNTAEFICKYFKKGQLMVIDGTLQTRTYTDKNNTERTIVEIVVDNAHFCESKKDKPQDNVPYTGAQAQASAQQNGVNGTYAPEPPYASDPAMTFDAEFANAPPDDFYPEFN